MNNTTALRKNSCRITPIDFFANSEEMENLARDAMQDEPPMSESDIDAFAKERGE